MMESDMGPAMEIQTFDRMTLFGRRWFFRIVDVNNHEKLAQSEAYNRCASRDATAHRFKRALGVPLRKVAK